MEVEDILKRSFTWYNQPFLPLLELHKNLQLRMLFRTYPSNDPECSRTSQSFALEVRVMGTFLCFPRKFIYQVSYIIVISKYSVHRILNAVHRRI